MRTRRYKHDDYRDMQLATTASRRPENDTPLVSRYGRNLGFEAESGGDKLCYTLPHSCFPWLAMILEGMSPSSLQASPDATRDRGLIGSARESSGMASVGHLHCIGSVRKLRSL